MYIFELGIEIFKKIIFDSFKNFLNIFKKYESFFPIFVNIFLFKKSKFSIIKLIRTSKKALSRAFT